MHGNEIALLTPFMGVLIRCEEVGKNIKINKWPPSCIKHPRLMLKYAIVPKCSFYNDHIKMAVYFKWRFNPLSL